jgi:hypothetical protein
MMIPGMNTTSTSNRMQKTIVAREHVDGLHSWHNGRTSGRMLKKTVQQGRSERRGEAYASVR